MIVNVYLVYIFILFYYKNNMKLIILILANDNGIYLECQRLWKKYMNIHPNIKSYFIKFKQNLDVNVLIQNDTIFVKGEESIIPGCLIKTIESIKYLLLNEDFHYIFRTNMSSVVDLNKLYNLLENYDKDYSGVVGEIHNVKFASGAGMLLSRYMCNYLIKNECFLDYNLVDDVSIGFLMKQNNISLHPLTRFESYFYENDISQITNDLIKNYYHFRCKSSFTDIYTILLMEKIINLIY